MSNEKKIERVNPIRLTDNETGEVYELDFSRNSIAFAENRGFKVQEVSDYPVTKIPELFYYAFRKNHKGVSRQKTDEILEELGGLTGPVLERLVALYNQGGMSHILVDEDEVKNSRMTVEL